MVNNVKMNEVQFTQKSLPNQAVKVATLHNQLKHKQNLHGEILRPHTKFLIALIPIKITGCHRQNCAEQH